MKDTKGGRQVLAEFGRKCSPVATLRNVDNPLVRPEYNDEAEQELQEIMLGMLPEEDDVKPGSAAKMKSGEFVYGHKAGWNAAIKLIEQNIRGGFNNG